MALLSKHLTDTAATLSATATRYGIQNKPAAAELTNLKSWGTHIYDPIVDNFGMVYLSSVYRCPLLNSKVGGSRSSGHLYGQAGDIDGDAPNDRYEKIDNVELFQWIRKNLKFDQLIAEFEDNGAPRWSHVGYRNSGNRGQVLIATKNNKGQTVYMLYTDKLFNQIYRRAKSFSFGMPDSFEFPEVELILDDEVFGTEFDNEVIGNRELNLTVGLIEPEPVKIEIPEVVVENTPLIVEDNPNFNHVPTVILHGGLKITIQVENA